MSQNPIYCSSWICWIIILISNLRCRVSSFLLSELYLHERVVTLPFWPADEKAKLKVKAGNGRTEHTETQRNWHRMIHCGLFLFIQTWDIDTTELSSLIASSTNKRLGRDLFFNIAVASSSLSQRKVTGSGPCQLQLMLRNGKS